MPHRYTLELANRSLPLVSRIVRDILDTYREWQQVIEAFELATAPSRVDRPSAEADVLQRRAESLAAEVRGFQGELTALGVEFKGFELGLVDFPGEIEGKAIFWCWKYGEPAVQFWHEVDAGFAERQPVEPLAALPRRS